MDARRLPITRTNFAGKGSTSFTQAYDRNGNVTSEGRTVSGVTGDAGTGTQSFTYDALDRVMQSAGLASGTRQYTYDRDGNRLSKSEGGITFTYAFDRTDQLVSVTKGAGTTQVFGYDARGNLTSDAQTGLSVTPYAYDLGNRLARIAAGTANDTTFTFDALGSYRTRILAATTETYTYVGGSEMVARVSQAPGVTTDSIVTPTGDRLGVNVGGTVNWFLPDLHGNVAASLTSDETKVSNAIRYDAYGQTITTGSAAGTTPVGEKTWKYQGRLDIAPAGLGTPLYDMGARVYAPGLGAFTSLDSVMGKAQNPLSMNRFLYAEGNPATLIDPTGHTACSAYADFCDRTVSSSSGTKQPTRTVNKKARQQYSYVGKRSRATRWKSFEKSLLKKSDPLLGVPACSAARLQCGMSQIDQMPVNGKKAFLGEIDSQYGDAGNFKGWFNNIQGILSFAGDNQLMAPGTWESVTDSSILGAIQDGLASQRQMSGSSASTNPGASQWADFFEYRGGDAPTDEGSRALWGRAEQTATDYGAAVAGRAGKVPTDDVKRTLITWGDRYRKAMADVDTRHSYAGSAGTKVGGIAGLPVGMPIPGAIAGGMVAPPLSDLANDPRQEAPAYWLSQTLYHSGGSFDGALSWIIGE